MRTQGTNAPLSSNNGALHPNAPALSERISFLEHLAEDAVLRLLDAPTLSAASSSTSSGGHSPSATFDSRERQGSLSSVGYSPGSSPLSSGVLSSESVPTIPENALYADDREHEGTGPVPSYSLSSNAFAPLCHFVRTAGFASSPDIELALASENLQHGASASVAHDLVLGPAPVVAGDFTALSLQYGRPGSGAEPSSTELATEWIRKLIERPGDSEWEVSGGQEWCAGL
ncbi:hypothetical protein FKP32DRAFT_1599970 [Trametes sanguinea]|nr:hypothetical protein FKP32DRAFT_1599970 [Trametes sanguinea]